MKKVMWSLMLAATITVMLAMSNKSVASGKFVLVDASGYGGRSGNIVNTYPGSL